MILAVAKGSLGYYYVGEDGLVYTEHSYHRTQSPLPPATRPTGKERQIAGCISYWLPTGQEEPLEGEQAEILEEAREALDLRWMVVEAREQVVCPECGKAAVRDERVHVDGRVPFVCEERHLSVDETETPEPVYIKT